MSAQEHPKYAKLVKRHAKVLTRLQRLGPRAQNLEHEMQSLVAIMAPLQIEANRRLVKQVKHSLDSIEKQIKVIEREPPPVAVVQPVQEAPVLQNPAAPVRAVHPVWNQAAQRFAEQLARQHHARRARQEVEHELQQAERMRQQEAQALLELELAAQREAEIVAQREAELALQAEFEEQLNTRPVVFGLDPDGGIDLRAFADDPQSVHRSSVQNSTHKAVVELINRPPPPADQDTLPEIVETFNTNATLRWPSNDVRDTVITELTDNYFNMAAFSISYSNVLDYVWAYICGHAEKTELTQRLVEELYEGIGMCSNGKMARLMNVLQGYDESLETAAPRELFQQRMGELSSKPMAERADAARALFAEFRIPESEHNAWLEPLLDN